MAKDPFYGVIADAPLETDFQLGTEEAERIPRARHKFEDNSIQYNQKEVSPVSCTVHGAMGAYSSLTGYQFPLEERKEIWAKALELGADPKVGWYTSRAVDLIRKHINAKGGRQVRTYRVRVGSDQFFKLLRLGYGLVVSYRGNSKYNADRNEDGILDGVAFGETTYGHCIFSAYSVGDEFDQLIDNYVGLRKFNIYKVPSENFQRLIDNGVFYSSAYAFIEEDEIPPAPDSEVPIWARSSYDKALAKGLISVGDDIFKTVGDAEMEEQFLRLGIFTKKEGSVSMIRWIVALDILGKLD